MSLIIIASVTVILLLFVSLSVLLSRQVFTLRHRVAIEEAGNRVLNRRLNETTELFESRLLRLEGVKGATGSRSRRRRQAAELVRQGADPLATARRCGLPSAELHLLLQLDQVKSERSLGDAN